MSTFTETRLMPAVSTHVPDYRLTRRGRLVVLIAGLIAVLAVGIVFAGVSLASDEPAAVETIVVAPGDTLWDLSAELSDDGDVRSMMSHIQQLNSLDSVALAAGQRLQVPVE